MSRVLGSANSACELKETDHAWHNLACDTCSSVGRGFAKLGLQQRLGIFSQRRSWPGADRAAGSRRHRTLVISSRTFDRRTFDQWVERSTGAIWLALSASLLASGLATASIAAASDRSPAVPRCVHDGGPSNFDYLVLASIADSPQLHAMASFRSTASQNSRSKSCDKDDVEHTTHKRIL